MNLYNRISEAFGASTQNNNRFEKAVARVKWDAVFSGDGVTFYEKDGATLVAETLNPFGFTIRPYFMATDGAIFEL